MLLRLFYHNVASFLTLIAVESEKKRGPMACAGISRASRPKIDSLPRYAPQTDSLPHNAKKRPQVGCLIARNDVRALPA